MSSKRNGSRSQRFWRLRDGAVASKETCRERDANLVGFFKVLLEWQAHDEKENEVADESKVRDIVDSGYGEGKR